MQDRLPPCTYRDRQSQSSTKTAMLIWPQRTTHMAHVVVTLQAFPVVHDPINRVVGCKTAWIGVHKVLHGLPQRWDRFHILMDRNHKSITLVVFPHECKRVIVHIAGHVRTRLYPPIPFVGIQQWVSKEETAIESAHMTVRLGAAVDDIILLQSSVRSSRLIFIHPRRI